MRDPVNRRLVTIGPVSVSQLGTAGLVAAGAEPTTALARELAAEWPPADQSDFARLMTTSGPHGRLAPNTLAVPTRRHRRDPLLSARGLLSRSRRSIKRGTQPRWVPRAAKSGAAIDNGGDWQARDERSGNTDAGCRCGPIHLLVPLIRAPSKLRSRSGSAADLEVAAQTLDSMFILSCSRRALCRCQERPSRWSRERHCLRLGRSPTAQCRRYPYVPQRPLALALEEARKAQRGRFHV